MTTHDFVPATHIEGIIHRPLKLFKDDRGWLMEFFRSDELAKDYLPAMGYLSITHPGVTRGPHEHINQTDLFCFAGPGDFLLVLWDNRPTSPTFRARMEMTTGNREPALVIVPPGVVHAYRCIGEIAGTVINVPNQLYKGFERKDPVDEIRHEADQTSPFTLDLQRRLKERQA